MKTRFLRYKNLWLAGTILIFFAGITLFWTAFGEMPVITSFHSNGTLSWTNSMNTNARYRVEWAPSPNGPWSFSVNTLGGGEFRNIGVGTNTHFAVDIPMFFRVRMLTNAPPPQMVLIPGGTFKMGDAFSGDGYPDELPAHNVNIDSFWISKTQVSREEWNEVANWATNRVPDSYQFDNTSSQFAMDRPSENISWYDAVKWCNAKSEKEGRSPVYFVPSGMLAFVYRAGQVDDVGIWTNANGYRLPTEAEWEYAARGGLRGRRFPYGDTISHQQACYYSINTYPYDISNTRGYFQGSSASVSVMAFAPNGYGLYNMSGNSRDFCWDRYVANYYSWGVTNNPHGPNGNAYPKRVTRGGASHFSAKENRTSFRHYSLPPDDVSLQLGFRTVIH